MSNHLIEKNLNRFHLSTYSVDSYSLIIDGRFHYTLFSALTDSITPVILFVTVGLRVGRYSLVSEPGFRNKHNKHRTDTLSTIHLN